MSFRGDLVRMCIGLCGCWLGVVTAPAGADVPQYRAIELYTFSNLAGSSRSAAPGAADAAGGQVVGQRVDNSEHALGWQDASGVPLDLHLGGLNNSIAF